MEDTQQTIGIKELLGEIDRDLDELRKKHPSDYGVKNLTMWWELEKDRLLVRHGSAAIRKPRRGWIDRHSALLLIGGAMAWIIGQLLLLLLR